MWGDHVIVERKEYLEKLIAWKDKKLIKIVTGVRRCGKSMLLEIYQNYLGLRKNRLFLLILKILIMRNLRIIKNYIII